MLSGRTAVPLLLVLRVRMLESTLASLWIDEEIALVSLIPFSIPRRWELRELRLLLLIARARVVIRVVHCK